ASGARGRRAERGTAGADRGPVGCAGGPGVNREARPSPSKPSAATFGPLRAGTQTLRRAQPTPGPALLRREVTICRDSMDSGKGLTWSDSSLSDDRVSQLRVATVQFEARPDDPAANLAVISDRSEERRVGEGDSAA